VVEPYPSEKYNFVNWDDYIFPIYGKIKHVPNHQPGRIFRVLNLTEGYS
jgi:hypothetical protein